MKRDRLSFADLERWLDQHRITEIECLVPDLAGVARGKILPREKFTEDRDMHLHPDLATVRIVPWAATPTAQVLHDCYDRQGELLPFAPI